ncbi:integral membrane protein DUF106-domain-containing protein [Tribonema minus]|uniref:Integral membrane protein DUF106-domain-containing protein n=1 Tax=Tribonema minus TaxID=303371 RepID=A0A835Z943_9STRA|nr:integral membrane protein DUF106-domain-containing protein [Tribonema minus]
MALASIAAVCLAALCSVGAELLNRKWYYDTEAFAKLVRTFDRLDEEIEKRKFDALYKTDDKRRARELKGVENLEKEKNLTETALQATKFKASLVTAVGMISGVWTLNRFFKGLVVFTLPFRAPFPFRLLTHRGLEGDDYRQISVTFMFILTAMLMRRVIDKKLGSPMPKALQKKTFASQWAELEAKNR